MIKPPQTECPRCGFSQPEEVACVRCGVVMARWNGPRAEGPRGERTSRAIVALVAVAALVVGGVVLREASRLAGGMLRAVGVAHARPAPRAARVAGASSWHEGAQGYADAEAERKRTGAAMVVYFHTDWCGWCRKLEADYLRSREVDAYLHGLVRVRLNPEDGAAENAIAERFGVRGFPSFYVVSADGGSQKRVHPFTTDGFMSPAEFVDACRAAE